MTKAYLIQALVGSTQVAVVHLHLGVVRMARDDISEDVSGSDIFNVGAVGPGNIKAEGRSLKRGFCKSEKR